MTEFRKIYEEIFGESERTQERIFNVELTQEKIFNAAIELFAAKGFKGTSIRDIAKRAGMNQATIYHHFGNKEGLLLSIVKLSSASLLTKLRQSLEQQQEPLERFKSLLTSHIRWTHEHESASKVFLLGEGDLSSEGTVILKKINDEFFNIYHAALIDLEKAGYMKGRNVKMLTFNIWGVLTAFLHWYFPQRHLSFEEEANEIVSFVLHGILAPGSEGTA